MLDHTNQDRWWEEFKSKNILGYTFSEFYRPSLLQNH